MGVGSKVNMCKRVRLAKPGLRPINEYVQNKIYRVFQVNNNWTDLLCNRITLNQFRIVLVRDHSTKDCH